VTDAEFIHACAVLSGVIAGLGAILVAAFLAFGRSDQ